MVTTLGFGKDGRGVILYERATGPLGALGATTAFSWSGRYTGNLEEDFRIIKLELYAQWSDITDGEGPIILGIADGFLATADIEAALETAPLSRNDPDLEMSHRAVWPLLILGDDGESSNSVCKQIEKNLRWTFSDPDAWKWWVYNISTAAITTGSFVDLFAKIYGVWVT